MVWMQTYLGFCSVRLGVIFITILTVLYNFIVSLIGLIQGNDAILPLLELLSYDKEFPIVVSFIKWCKNNPTKFIVIIEIWLFTRMLTTLLATFGAFKLTKWQLLPYILLDMLLVLLYFIVHILIMLALKRTINLGALIALTLLGFFMQLFFIHNLVAVMTLYQMINLINSQNYQKLYGKHTANKRVLVVRKLPKKQHHFQVVKNPTTFDKKVSNEYNNNYNNLLLYKPNLWQKHAQEILEPPPPSWNALNYVNWQPYQTNYNFNRY